MNTSRGLRRLCACAAAALLLTAPAAHGAAGDRDESFGVRGEASAGQGMSYDVADGPGGTVVLGGWSPDAGGQQAFGVTRLTSTGRFDSGFGRGGAITTAFADITYPTADRVAALADGGVLAMGGGSSPSGFGRELLLARYGPGGSLRTTFAGGGKTVVVLPGGYRAEPGLRSLVVADDGTFYVSLTVAVPEPFDYRAAVVKFTAEGAFDTTFGVGGIAVRSGSIGGDLAIDTEGRPVVVGAFPAADGQSTPWGIARFTSDGAPDASFGTDGVATPVGSTPTFEFRGLTTLPDDRILVTGTGDREDPLAGEDGVPLLRLREDGTLDPTFGGGDGQVVAPWGYRPQGLDVLRRPDGRVLVVACEQVGSEIQVLGFAEDGAPDPGWGIGSEALGLHEARCPGAAILDPSGRVLVTADTRVARLRRPVNDLPTVTIAPPAAPARIDAPYALEATAADPDGRLLSIVWDLDDDGAFDDASGRAANPRFATAGTKRVAVRVTDDDGARATAERSVTVVANAAPTARITAAPASPLAGDPVALDPAGSADPDGTLVRYEWDLDGDGGFETDGTTPEVRTTTFATPGSRTVALRVTSSDGAVATATQGVVVRSHAPFVQIDDRVTDPGVPVSFTVSAGAADGGRIAAVAWDLDDDGAFDDGTGRTAAPVFRTTGPHVVTVRVTDDRGSSAEDEAVVTVRNAAPVPAVAITPAVSTFGTDTVLDAAASSVPGGAIVRYEWDLDGDGSFEAVRTSPQLTHRFARTGLRIVRLRVTDAAGATASLEFEVRVANAAPVAAFAVAPGTPAAGAVATLDAGASTDPGGAGLASYRWDTDGVGGADVVSGLPTASYRFPVPGTYPVSLTVRDYDGASSTVTANVVVVAASARPALDGVAGPGPVARAEPVPATPTAATGPRLVLRAPAAIRAGALRSGLPVRIRCSARCRVRLTLSEGRRRVASRTVALPRGTSTRRVTPSRAGRSGLGRPGHRRLTLRAEVAGQVVFRGVEVVR